MISVDRADALAEGVFAGLRTAIGGLAIEHARRVAASVAIHGDRAVIVGLLHDTVEKNCIGWPALASAVDDEEVLRSIDALTQRPSENDEEYLGRCVKNATAVVVKRADLLDKLGPQEAGVPAHPDSRARTVAGARLALFDQLCAGADVLSAPGGAR